MFLLCHDHFGRWEYKLIGADTPLLFLQGVNYGVHGWVGFVYNEEVKPYEIRKAFSFSEANPKTIINQRRQPFGCLLWLKRGYV